MLALLLWGFLFITSSVSAKNSDVLIENLKPILSDARQTKAVRKLLNRLLPQDAGRFDLAVDGSLRSSNGLDRAVIESIGSNRIRITGSTGATSAWGLNHYLKYYCNCQVTWNFSQLNLPKTLPPVNKTLTTNDPVRYYQNVCQYGYSFVWWKWRDWRKHIDWMALNGLNLVLAASGQEAVWLEVYKTIGMEEKEVLEHFTGPAFLPWNRMGNIKSWGGPLTQSWIDRDRRMQHRILKALRSLGIVPVVPAFVGHIPERVVQKYPNATYLKLPNWGHFDERYSGLHLLEPGQELFTRISTLFLDLYRKEFGSITHFYSADAFNEMSPDSVGHNYLHNFGKSLFRSMTESDKSAVWVMQGWMFYHDQKFWTKPRAQELLTSVPQGRLLVLDLTSLNREQYTRLDSYFGQPFVVDMLENYGATTPMFGRVERINQIPFEARETPSMVGLGIAPEGIPASMNYAMYDLMLEMIWRQTPIQDIETWFKKFAHRRYGRPELSSVWISLSQSVFNCTEDEFRNDLLPRPKSQNSF